MTREEALKNNVCPWCHHDNPKINIVVHETYTYEYEAILKILNSRMKGAVYNVLDDPCKVDEENEDHPICTSCKRVLTQTQAGIILEAQDFLRKDKPLPFGE